MRTRCGRPRVRRGAERLGRCRASARGGARRSTATSVTIASRCSRCPIWRISRSRGDDERAEALCEEALAVAEALDDDSCVVSGALSMLSDVARGAMVNTSERSRCHGGGAGRYGRGLGDPLLVTDAMYHARSAAFHAGDHARARAGVRRALEHARALGEEQYTAAALLHARRRRPLAGDLARRRASRESSGSTRGSRTTDAGPSASLVLAGMRSRAEHSRTRRRLLGAADALRADDPPDESRRARLDSSATPSDSNDVLGAERSRTLRLEGRAWIRATSSARLSRRTARSRVALVLRLRRDPMERCTSRGETVTCSSASATASIREVTSEVRLDVAKLNEALADAAERRSRPRLVAGRDKTRSWIADQRSSRVEFIAHNPHIRRQVRSRRTR